MPTDQEERTEIAERLAEIKAGPSVHPEKPSEQQACSEDKEKLDRETTKLLKKLADDTPVKPVSG